MISWRELVRALQRRAVADWVVIERVRECAGLDEATDRARALRRSEQATRATVIVHHDVPRGRGSARLELHAVDGGALAAVDQAISLAAAAIGPAWKMVPPAAPAKVAVLDPALDKVDLGDAAAGYLRGVRRPAGATVTAGIELIRERVAVQSRTGFHVSWSASHVRARALVVAGGRSVELTRVGRRLADLGFDAALAAAVADLGQLGGAGAPVAGTCALVLTADALLHGDELGAWEVFAAQADSVLERQGLTRYRPGAPIAPGADQVAEPLTITSDGALDFATRSAPVGDDGDSIRRFALVERGVCAGLGLTGREAALRHLDPNGGVRNLVVAPGTWTEPAAAGRPDRVVEVRRLRALAIDPYTGDASLELGLAIDRTGARRTPFTGGTVRLDLIAALARARRSATVIQRGAYRGPDAVLIEGAELLA